MKHTEANTPRAQEAIARFGKHAIQHPLCKRALDFWEIDKQLSDLTKWVLERKATINTLKQERRRATTLLDWFYDNGKQKECVQAYQIVRKIDNDLLPAMEKGYLVLGEIWLTYDLWKTTAYALFQIERAAYKRDNNAQKALQRIRKRWEVHVNGAPAKDSDARVLGIIELLRRKVFEAIRAKDGVVAAYAEKAVNDNRALSDEIWQGRVTAREIHSYLSATYGGKVAGDKDAKVIRRLTDDLGIRLAEDKVGRKWEEPIPTAQQKPKQPRGRPRKGPDLTYTDIEAVQHIQEAANRGKPLTGYGDIELLRQPDSERDEFELLHKEKLAEIELAQWEFEQGQAEIEREIAKLKRLQRKSGVKPLLKTKRKPRKLEGMIKGRNATFAAFIDSLPVLDSDGSRGIYVNE